MYLSVYWTRGGVPSTDIPPDPRILASMDMEERYRLIISTIFNAIGCGGRWSVRLPQAG